MSDYGIKIAKTGERVQDAPLNKLIFHSGKPLLKIWGMFDATITYTQDQAGLDILLIAHNLGYVPKIRAQAQWYDINTGQKRSTYRKAPIYDSFLDGSMNFVFRPYATNTEVRLVVGGHDGRGSKNVSLGFMFVVYYDPDKE